MVWRSALRQLAEAQRGGALAEAAIVLPLLLLLIFATVWFGLLIHTHVVVQIAAGQGARVGAVAYAKDPESREEPPPDEVVRGFVRAVIYGGLKDSDLEAIAVERVPILGQDAVRVTVTYRFKMLVPFMSEWGSPTAGDGIAVVKSSVYRVERVVADED